MAFTVKVRTDYSPPDHQLSVITGPAWNEDAKVAGTYRWGTWRFELPDPPAEGQRLEFKFFDDTAGWMLDPNLSCDWISRGAVFYGPTAVAFPGAPPSRLRLADMVGLRSRSLDWLSATVIGKAAHVVGRIILLIILFGVLLVPLPVWAMYDGSDHTSPACPANTAANTTLPTTANAAFKLSDPNATAGHTLAFGRSRNSRTLILSLSPVSAVSNSASASASTTATLPANEQLGSAVTGLFTRSDDETLNSSLIYTAAKVEGGQVTLTVCARRSNDKPLMTLGDAGSYTGSVSIAGTDVVRSDIPITVTLSYPAWQLVLELLVLVLIPAAWYLWILHDSNNDNADAVAWALVRYCTSRIGFLSLAVGAIAGFSVYSATYLSSSTWGSASSQPLALYGAMFTAFVAGAGGVHLAAKAAS
jgi:hypothetical protein